jgi:predicted phosphodiesterase
MTRLAVLADIHGNLPALRAVLDDMASFQVDRVVVAGDVINWGPFSPQVMEIVARERWAVVRGNNEFYLLEYRTPRQPEHWRDYTLLPWLHAQLAGRWQREIAAWPDELSLRFPNAPPIRVLHGLPANPWRGMHPLLSDDELAALLEPVAEPTVIGAHTHLAMSRRVADRHVLNPGSVGLPLDGKIRADYMILDGDEAGWRPTFRRLPYDRAPLLAEFARQRFVAQGGPVAELVVREFETGRLWVLPYLAWRQGHAPGGPDSPELLAAFLAQDPWPYTPPEYHRGTIEASREGSREGEALP